MMHDKIEFLSAYTITKGATADGRSTYSVTYNK